MGSSEVLIEAAEVMQRQGKCEGVYRSEDGRVCAIEAVFEAATGKVDLRETMRFEGDYLTPVAVDAYYDARSALAEWVDEHFPETEGTIARWSDTRTQDEVVAGLREAAGRVGGECVTA
jgi:hypothetical protein